MYLDLWIVVLSAVIGCYFAACHTALKTFSRKRLEDLLEDRGKAHRLEPTSRHLEGLMLMTGVARATLSITLVLAILHYVMRVCPDWDQPGTYLLAFGVSAVVLGVFGVALPTSWAVYRREKLLAWSLPMLQTLRILFMPLTLSLRLVDPVVRRLSGVDLPTAEDDANGLTEEVLTVVEDRLPDANVDQAQKQMLEAVFELPTTTAEEIMTPRTDVKGIEINATLEQVRQTIVEAGHSRMPVYDQSVDHIQGLIYAKDLITYVRHGQGQGQNHVHGGGHAAAHHDNGSDTGNGNSNGTAKAKAKAKAEVEADERQPQTLAHANEPAFNLRHLLREPYMVPESKSVSELLSEFKAQKVHIAVVLDEYGGTAGLVTIEDILEEIVGEIQDEYEDAADQPPEIKPIDQTTSEVEARVYIDDLNDAMEIQLPENEDYETVGGFVLSKLGHIPDQDESFTFENIRFTVIEAERTRVGRVKVEKLQVAEVEANQPPQNGQ